ncbi:MAG: SpoIIIAH-like family protein [Clostridia bacterium]|nr:SpoIIIAH-like family protein [Clostridia bacterium]
MKEKRFGKKQMVLGLMVLLLGAAVYLNYYVASNTPTVSAPTGTTATTRALGESQFVNSTVAEEDYFTAARRNREAARQEALDILQETLQDVKLEASLQQEAVTAAAAEAKAVEQEDAVESLIKAKGFADCVAYLENGVCHVAVKAAELTEAETLQISQIVMSQTGISAQNLQITAVE